MSLGPAEILVIFVIALLVFGPTRLPEIGRQVGKGIRELRKFQHSMRSDFEDAFTEDASEDASEHAEPAPQLPPKSEPSEDAPSAGAGEGTPAPPEPS